MNFLKTKNEAKRLSNIRNMDHAILFDGLNYFIVIAKRHKGSYVEIVKPDKPNVSKKRAKDL
jgi:hypothetical protein